MFILIVSREVMDPIDESKKRELEDIPESEIKTPQVARRTDTIRPSREIPTEEINRATERIERLMKENAVDELAIERKYLPEIFSVNLLKLSKDGLPKLKSFVVKEFYYRDIFTKLYGNVVKFFKTNGFVL